MSGDQHRLGSSRAPAPEREMPASPGARARWSTSAAPRTTCRVPDKTPHPRWLETGCWHSTSREPNSGPCRAAARPTTRRPNRPARGIRGTGSPRRRPPRRARERSRFRSARRERDPVPSSELGGSMSADESPRRTKARGAIDTVISRARTRQAARAATLQVDQAARLPLNARVSGLANLLAALLDVFGRVARVDH